MIAIINLLEISPGSLIKHYKILSRLGAGGMGEVFVAEDTQLRRKVAIKFVKLDSTSDERLKSRMMREARAAATLDHPNICAIYEVGEEYGRGYIVLQYVQGETLAALLRQGPLELNTALVIATQIANALAEAHKRGIIISTKLLIAAQDNHMLTLDLLTKKVGEVSLPLGLSLLNAEFNEIEKSIILRSETSESDVWLMKPVMQ